MVRLRSSYLEVIMFKDSKNQWLTRGLFYELNDYRVTDFTQFTLGEVDIDKKGKTLVSLRRLFVEGGDPIEYTFAVEHLGGWSHWQALLNCNDLMPYVEAWRDELEVKIRSQAFRQIGVAADGGSVPAQKLLADRGWHQRKAGAPSKLEKAAQVKSDKKTDKVVQGDFNRLGLHKK